MKAALRAEEMQHSPSLFGFRSDQLDQFHQFSGVAAGSSDAEQSLWVLHKEQLLNTPTLNLTWPVLPPPLSFAGLLKTTSLLGLP